MTDTQLEKKKKNKKSKEESIILRKWTFLRGVNVSTWTKLKCLQNK